MMDEVHRGISWRSVRWMPLLIMLMVGVIVFAVQPTVVQAHDAVPHSGAALDLIGFDQRLDNEVPADLAFLDENSQRVKLGHYFKENPVILALTYYECTTLCPLVREGLVESLRPLAFTVGDEFDVVIVSIDPEETPAIATAAKNETLAAYDRPDSADGWHFLTGDHDTIDQLADSIGFRYAYDGERDEFAHASGIVLLTSLGRVARYFYGIEYATNDLRLGLVETSQNRIGTPIDQLLLFCYHYEPGVGKYNLLIMNVLRLAGILTIAVMGAGFLVLWRQDSRSKESRSAPTLG